MATKSELDLEHACTNVMTSSLYIRLSVTERCNLRCSYCRPSACPPNRPSELPIDDILRLASTVNGAIPIAKVRLTGGEPLVRNDICEIVRQLREHFPDATLALTTNGVRLARFAHPLRAAGLDALNVSLDSVERAGFSSVTGGGRLDSTLAGLESAMDAGFSRLKINTVLMRGITDLGAIVRLASRFRAEPRFIELMPTGAGAALYEQRRLTSKEALSMLASELGCAPELLGHEGTATRYRFKSGNHATVVGFITPLSHPFCNSCNRLRIDSQGRLIGCLRSPQQEDLLAIVRAGDQSAARSLVHGTLARKTRMPRGWTSRTMVAIGG